MIYTVQNMVKRIRWETNHDESEFSGSSDLEMMYVSQAQDFIFDTISDLRPEILSHYFDLTLTGASSYYIPDSIPFDYEQILFIEDITSTDSPVRTSPSSWFDRMEYFEGDILTNSVPFSVRDNYIEFPYKTNSATMRVWYTRRPVPLHYGTVGTVGATTVVFPSVSTGGGELRLEDDYYNGMKIYSTGQIRTISDYVGSTRTATISTAWTTNPTSNTSTYSLLSPLPERLHPLIAEVAVRLIKIAQDDDDTQVARFVNEAIDNILKRLRRPVKSGADRIRKVNRFN